MRTYVCLCVCVCGAFAWAPIRGHCVCWTRRAARRADNNSLMCAVCPLYLLAAGRRDSLALAIVGAQGAPELQLGGAATRSRRAACQVGARRAGARHWRDGRRRRPSWPEGAACCGRPARPGHFSSSGARTHTRPALGRDSHTRPRIPTHRGRPARLAAPMTATRAARRRHTRVGPARATHSAGTSRVSTFRLRARSIFHG